MNERVDYQDGERAKHVLYRELPRFPAGCLCTPGELAILDPLVTPLHTPPIGQPLAGDAFEGFGGALAGFLLASIVRPMKRSMIAHPPRFAPPPRNKIPPLFPFFACQAENKACTVWVIAEPGPLWDKRKS